MPQWTWECRYLYQILILILLNKYPEVEIAGLHGILRNRYTVFHGSCTIFHSHQQYTRFDFSTYLSALAVFCCFVNGYPNRCEVGPHCGFIYISPMTNDVEHLFIYLLAICRSSLGRSLFKSFAHFLIQCYLIFCSWVVEVPYIFWILINPLSDMYLQIFSPILWVAFHSVDFFFALQKLTVFFFLKSFAH